MRSLTKLLFRLNFDFLYAKAYRQLSGKIMLEEKLA